MSTTIKNTENNSKKQAVKNVNVSTSTVENVEQSEQNLAFNSVQNFVVNKQNIELYDVKTGEKKDTIERVKTIANYESYLNNLKAQKTFQGIAFAHSYKTNSKLDIVEYKDNNATLENNNNRLNNGIRAVMCTHCDERNNTMFLITINNELLVEIQNNCIYPVICYSRVFLELSSTYFETKRNTATGTDRKKVYETKNNITSSMNIDIIKNCMDENELQTLKNEFDIKIAAISKAYVEQKEYINSDECKNEKLIQKYINQNNFSRDEAVEYLQFKKLLPADYIDNKKENESEMTINEETK